MKQNRGKAMKAVKLNTYMETARFPVSLSCSPEVKRDFLQSLFVLQYRILFLQNIHKLTG